MHWQQSTDEVNHGETPTTSVMTNIYVFRIENPASVSRIGWKGAYEIGDLLILLSQDRWWLREMSYKESFAVAFATLFTALLRRSLGRLQLHDQVFANVCRVVCTEGEPKKYERRLDMADDLIDMTKIEDWAVRMGSSFRREKSQFVNVRYFTTSGVVLTSFYSYQPWFSIL
ncbi:hypothetical protein ARMSODRAFT_976035 [Armillaria solidipes]|uniref:Uncharacterized protein n=1 Tax=Armillaria solidipes TaxID=1076256 RepID=A0A2H3BW93_9AGAR|nr:hypothetical protein ARMSODRAFT_976035 [Armillaria solidipes]